MPTISLISTSAQDFLQQINHLKESVPAEGDLSKRLLRGCYKRVLSDLEGIITVEAEPAKLASQLKGYLSAHWALIKGTSLSYTALPEDGLTGLLVDVASFVAETIEGSEDEPLYPLTVLMPTVAVESLVDDKDYPSLNELALQEVLRTHILGKEGSYLVPVRQLIDLQEKPKNEWYNTYYDYKTPSKETALLSPEDYEQLGNHSSYTKALIEAKAQYELSLKEQGSLLYHLRELSSKLYFNSVLGVGIEENAGTGTYDAIIQFNDYYSKLDEVSKEKIPPAVKQEIDLLLTLSSDSTKNIKATSQIETCIKIRRESLVAAITPQEQVLSEIGLTEETAKTLAAEKKAQFISCQKELKNAIEEKKYQGIDKRGLTLELVKTLNVDIAISSAADLQEIVKLSCDELDGLFKEEALQKQFVGQFDSLETLVLFIHQTPIPKLKLLLDACGKSLGNKLTPGPGDLAALLISLDAERVSLVISVMGDKIKDEYDFANLINILSPEQDLAACKAIKEKLPEIIKSAFGLRRILEPLSLEQRPVVFEAVKEKFPEIIKTAYEFKSTLEYLSSEQRAILFEAMKEKLPEIIKTAYEFKSTLEYLSSEQRAILFETMKEKLPEIIKTTGEFDSAFQFLPSEQQIVLLDIIKDKIPQLELKKFNYKFLLQSLSPEALVVVCETTKDRWVGLIADADEFRILLNELSSEQCRIVCNHIKNKFRDIIQDNEDLGLVLRGLSPDKCRIVFETVKDQTFELFDTVTKFSRFLQYLSPEQCQSVYEVIGEEIGYLVKNINHLFQLFAEMNEPKMVSFLATLPHFHRLIINVKQDFPIIDKLFETNECKKQFHQAYFKSLLVDIKASGSSQDEAFDGLCKRLEDEATAYFTGQTDIGAFKDSCQSTIEEAKAHLRGQEPVLNLLGKWMLAIFTLGAAVAYSSLNTKIQTGEWTCNFFKVPGEVDADKLKDIVTKEFKP
ncbi:hypothetical protein [Legionella feeleii]|uniref:Uncharacterized protein n=1 Tax=Legionella feeleii TaxID=453 RepID=A0A378IWC1_9GAMM|nr:hypothetical protein [Legionella feeleii]STX38781.1 Uncharacterised protein [Legionella feeleii]